MPRKQTSHSTPAPFNRADHSCSPDRAGDRQRVTLLHNPTAGDGRASGAELKEALEAAGYRVAYADMKSEDWAALLHRPADLVAVAGGDGTLGRVLPRLSPDGAPFTIIPLGTANNLATALGVAGTPSAVAAGLPDARARPFDLGRIEGPWPAGCFIEAVGFGALAASLAAGGAGKAGANKIEAGRQALAHILADTAAWEGELQVDGEAHRGRWLIVEILNLGRTGPRLPLIQSTETGDGQLDAFLLAESERTSMLEWLAGNRRSPAPGTRLRGKDFSFDWDGSLPFRIDDELQDRPAHRAGVRVRPREGQLRVLIPTLSEADDER